MQGPQCHLLSSRYEQLNHGIKIDETSIELDPVGSCMGEREPPTAGSKIRTTIRPYNPSSISLGLTSAYVSPGQPEPEVRNIAIYYHGCDLAAGDLDSENLTCRGICKELNCTVYSCDYRHMPERKGRSRLDAAIY
jgi:acetyl esterase/lipase